MDFINFCETVRQADLAELLNDPRKYSEFVEKNSEVLQGLNFTTDVDIFKLLWTSSPNVLVNPDFFNNLKNAIILNDTRVVRASLSNKHSELLRQPANICLIKSLMIEAKSLDNDVIELLLEFMAFKADNVYAKSFLVCSIHTGNLKLTEVLLKKGVSFFEDTEWYEVFQLCEAIVRTEKPKQMLALLIEHGMDTKFRSKKGHNILDTLVELADKKDPDVEEIVEMILETGVSINECDDVGTSPILRAVLRNHVPLIGILIRKGADVNSKLKNGLDCLHIAVYCSNEEMVDLLITSGARVNALNSTFSALHVACMDNHHNIIDLLIRKGARTDVKCNSKTPFALLKPREYSYERSLIVMVKEFSRLIFGKLAISDEDMDLMQKTPSAKKHFERCTMELEEMAKRKFYPPYSYYWVLKMSRKIGRLASLTKNHELVSSFEANVGGFSYYKDDLERIFEEAKMVRDRLEVVQSRLHEIFKDYLPDVVVDKLAVNLGIEDLPMMSLTERSQKKRAIFKST